VKGVVLARVDPDGPAAKAHLQAGDIITQINNHPIDQPERINYLILQHEPGETITIQYWRNGQTHTVEVTLSRLPARLEAPPAPPAPPIP
jgi:serine protease Do